MLNREKYLLTLGIVRVLDERYAALPRPGPCLQMLVTNLRNRPLESAGVRSLCGSVLSLYHSLVTGSKDFPSIAAKGFSRTAKTASPFPHAEQSCRENTKPSPLMNAPAGVMVPAAAVSPPNILTPVLPERTELEALKADPRNSILKVAGRSDIRVISTVYSSEGSELTDRWRVTDYGADGHVLMSVLCRFTGKSARFAKTPRQQKRKRAEEESSSSQRPPEKHWRL